MGKNKKIVQFDVWCYYCDLEFDNEKILKKHQEEKHLKCHVCHTKISCTIRQLCIHALMAHKDIITKVPNAKPGRESINIEVYGMHGIPPEFLAARYEQDEEEPPSKFAKVDFSQTRRISNMVPTRSYHAPRIPDIAPATQRGEPEVYLIFDDKDMSMEERRMSLPKYRVHRETSELLKLSVEDQTPSNAVDRGVPTSNYHAPEFPEHELVNLHGNACYLYARGPVASLIDFKGIASATPRSGIEVQYFIFDDKEMSMEEMRMSLPKYQMSSVDGEMPRS